MPSLRYVVLRHSEISEPHFDLMFETLPGSALATWRSESWPIDHRTPLTRLRDHRRFYLDYEGQLSDQRGEVYRMAEGNCELNVGENAIWTIQLLSGSLPQRLVFRQISGDQWEVEPA